MKIDQKKLLSATMELVHLGKQMAVGAVLLEQQPPQFTRLSGKKGKYYIPRIMTVIENQIYGAMCGAGLNVEKISPAACKRFHNACASDYQQNKNLAIERASNLVGNEIPNDHVADCVLMAVFYYEKNCKAEERFSQSEFGTTEDAVSDFDSDSDSDYYPSDLE
ncbi:hypothetical protein KJ807_05575 [Patescibacteria group bacterium]|nr:hypothetical protein [Patescibacteria group bacterium]